MAYLGKSPAYSDTLDKKDGYRPVFITKPLNNEPVPEGYVTQLEAERLSAQPQRHFCLVGGARSGKTVLHVKNIVSRAIRAPGSRHLIVRWHFKDAWTSVGLETFPFVMKWFFPEYKYELNGTYRYFTLKKYENDEESQIWIGGLGDAASADNVLGREYVTILCCECSQLPYSVINLLIGRLAQVCQQRSGKKLSQRMYYDLNPTGKTHWTNVLFGDHRDPTERTKLPDPDNYVRAFLHPIGNKRNLDESYLQSLANMPTRQRARFYDGRYVDEATNALWTFDLLERCRVPDVDMDQMSRVVVAVDPSGAGSAADDTHDAIGIIVAGRHKNGHCYVLEDLTRLDSPSGWAKTAIAAYRKWHADRIIGEINFGGAMVESVLRSVDHSIAFKSITASRGKTLRAEPIAALYGDPMELVSAEGELKNPPKVHHVGKFIDLEGEMLGFTDLGYVGERSPNRCIAEGTFVATNKGSVVIEDIRVGDLVLTRRGYKRVLAQCLTQESALLYRVETNHGCFEATPDHVVLTLRGWLRVDALLHDDNLFALYAAKHFGAAGILSVTKLSERKSVYDLAIEDAHEFFANGILVHNCDALVHALTELALGDSASGWLDFYKRQADIATGKAEKRELPPEVAAKGMRASQEYYLPGQRAWEKNRKQHEKVTQVGGIDTSGAITMRAPTPYWNGFASGTDGRAKKYTADGDGLIHGVAVVHIESLHRAGCIPA